MANNSTGDNVNELIDDEAEVEYDGQDQDENFDDQEDQEMDDVAEETNSEMEETSVLSYHRKDNEDIARREQQEDQDQDENENVVVAPVKRGRLTKTKTVVDDSESDDDNNRSKRPRLAVEADSYVPEICPPPTTVSSLSTPITPCLPLVTNTNVSSSSSSSSNPAYPCLPLVDDTFSTALVPTRPAEGEEFRRHAEHHRLLVEALEAEERPLEELIEARRNMPRNEENIKAFYHLNDISPEDDPALGGGCGGCDGDVASAYSSSSSSSSSLNSSPSHSSSSGNHGVGGVGGGAPEPVPENDERRTLWLRVWRAAAHQTPASEMSRLLSNDEVKYIIAIMFHNLTCIEETHSRTTPIEYYGTIAHMLNIRMFESSVKEIEDAYVRVAHVLSLINEIGVEKGLLGEKRDQTEMTEKLAKVAEMLHTTQNVFSYMAYGWKTCRYKKVTTINDKTDAKTIITPFLFRPDVEYGPIQNLICFVLDKLHLLGYRRIGTECYSQILTPEGYVTNAYKQECTILQFIYRCVDRRLHPDQFKNLTTSNVAKCVENYLTNCRDPLFPAIEKDRHLFSWRDGIYDCQTHKFYRYSRGEYPDTDKASANYVDVEFPDYTNAASLLDIPTPFLDKLLDTQGWAPECKLICYAFLGRFLYDIGELDSWQVVPYLWGTAGSGKSTMTQIVSGWFSPEDVGELANNIERGFGLSSLINKLVIVGAEIKNNFNMDQAQWQQLVGGERCNVQIKGKTAFSYVFKSRLFMAGNDYPGWEDSAGSVERRMVVFAFLKKLTQGVISDPRDVMRRESPLLMQKCNLAYKELVAKVGKDDIWTHLPEMFKNTRQSLRSEINPVAGFLNTGVLVQVDPKDVTETDPPSEPPSVLYEEIKRAYSDYLANSKMPIKPLHRASLVAGLGERNMDLVEVQRSIGGRRNVTVSVVPFCTLNAEAIKRARA